MGVSAYTLAVRAGHRGDDQVDRSNNASYRSIERDVSQTYGDRASCLRNFDRSIPANA
jgi:hypothetical protein